MSTYGGPETPRWAAGLGPRAEKPLGTRVSLQVFPLLSALISARKLPCQGLRCCQASPPCLGLCGPQERPASTWPHL